MKFLSFILLILLSFQISAHERNSSFCDSFTFDSYRHQCVDKIISIDYFDNRALEVCRRMTFDSGKMECLSVIGNKEYDRMEVSDCGRMTFDNEILMCLGRRGEFVSYRRDHYSHRHCGHYPVIWYPGIDVRIKF
jgi:hypothetical protein